MPKPNFFIIGAAKAGTTSLAYYLSLQPHIFFSTPKELNFFNDKKLYSAKIEWYEKHFDKVSCETAIGEGSPLYASCITRPGTAQNIYNYNPNSKFIYLIRHPFERINSHYLQLLNNGYCGRIPMAKAIKEYPELLESSLYWRQISEYKMYFKDEQILVLFFEEFKSNPSLIVKKCCEFLDVPFQTLPEKVYEVKNATKDHYEDRLLYQTVKKIIPINIPIQKIPKSVKSIGRTLLRQPQKPAPKWDENLLKTVVPVVQEDLHHFLQYAGKPESYYKLPQP